MHSWIRHWYCAYAVDRVDQPKHRRTQKIIGAVGNRVDEVSQRAPSPDTVLILSCSCCIPDRMILVPVHEGIFDQEDGCLLP